MILRRQFQNRRHGDLHVFVFTLEMAAFLWKNDYASYLDPLRDCFSKVLCFHLEDDHMFKNPLCLKFPI